MKQSYDTLSRRQLGLVTGAQLIALGWSHNAVVHLVRRGQLIRVRHRVYRTAGSALTADQAVLAAVMAAGERALLAQASGARHWGFTSIPKPDKIHILTDSWSQPRLAGVQGHRTIWLPDNHRTKHRSIPIAIAERVLVDCCGLVGAKALRAAVNDGLRRKIVTLPRLTRVVDEVPSSWSTVDRPDGRAPDDEGGGLRPR
jgi:predicted transcriptional regulator of viral defense system